MEKLIRLVLVFVFISFGVHAQIKLKVELSKVNFNVLKKADIISGTYKNASVFDKYVLLSNVTDRFVLQKRLLTTTKQATSSNGITYYISKENITLPPSSTGTTTNRATNNNELICHSTPINIAKQFQSGLLMIPNSQAVENTKIYPGALFKDIDIVKGVFAPYNLPRKPGTIGINVVSANSVIQDVQNFGDKNTVNESISQLLSRVGSSSANTDHYSTSIEFKSSDDLSMNIESSTSVDLESILGISSMVGGAVQAGVSLSTEFNTAVAYIRNVNYTISVGGTGGPQSTIDGNIPSDAVCVTDVMYGSVAFIIVSNLRTRLEAKAVAESLLSAGDVVNSNTNISVEAQHALSIGAVSVMVYGGTGASSVNTVTSINQLRTELAKGNNTVAGVNAMPVFYTLSYASDNAPVKTAAYASYTDTRCYKASKLVVKVSGSLLLAGEADGTEELYGNIRLEGQASSLINDNYFFNKTIESALSRTSSGALSILPMLNAEITFNINPALADFDNEVLQLKINIKDKIEAGIEWGGASNEAKENGYVQYSPINRNINLSEILNSPDKKLTRNFDVTEGNSTIRVNVSFEFRQ